VRNQINGGSELGLECSPDSSVRNVHIWFDNVDCSGSSTVLVNETFICNFDWWYSHSQLDW